MDIRLQTNTANPSLEFRSIHTSTIETIRIELWIRSGEFIVEHHRIYFELQTISEFTTQLKSMDRNLTGKAVLKPLYESEFIMLELDHKGHVKVSGEMYGICPSQKLSFEFETDQTCLAPLQRKFQKLCDLLV